MSLPDSWERVQLGKIVRIHSGVAPSLLQLSLTGYIPYVKVEDLNRSAKHIQSSREFTDAVMNVTPSGSTVFPKRGAAIMTNKVRFAARDIVLDTNLMALAPGRRIDADFL